MYAPSSSSSSFDIALDELSRGQLGLVSSSQVFGLPGGSPKSIRSRIESGKLMQVQQGVYRVGGTQMSYRRQLIAATLAAGGEAVASHRSALCLWRLVNGQQPVEITVIRPRKPDVRDAVLHRSLDLTQQHVTRHRQVPVTNPLRTLVDAGAVLHGWQVGQCVELALTRRLVTVRGLRQMLDEVAKRGRRGAGVLRTYLDDRALGDQRPESVLEPLFARLCRDHGIGAVEFQPALVLEGRVIRPDFGLLDVRVLVEIDGLAVHGTREALDHDLSRQNLLMRHGYVVLRYTSTHLRQPARVAREIITVARNRLPQSVLGTDSAA